MATLNNLLSNQMSTQLGSLAAPVQPGAAMANIVGGLGKMYAQGEQMKLANLLQQQEQQKEQDLIQQKMQHDQMLAEQKAQMEIDKEQRLRKHQAHKFGAQKVAEAQQKQLIKSRDDAARVYSDSVSMFLGEPLRSGQMLPKQKGEDLLSQYEVPKQQVETQEQDPYANIYSEQVEQKNIEAENKFKEKLRVLEADKWLDRRPDLQEKLDSLKTTNYLRTNLKSRIFPPSGNRPTSGKGVAAKQTVKTYIANFLGLSQSKKSLELQEFIDVMNSYASTAGLGKTNLLPGQISNKEIDELKNIDMSIKDEPGAMQEKFLFLGSKDLLDKILLSAQIEYGDKYGSERLGNEEITKKLGNKETLLRATTAHPMFQSKIVPGAPMTLMEFLSQDANDFDDLDKGRAFENATDFQKLKMWRDHAGR